MAYFNEDNVTEQMCIEIAKVLWRKLNVNVPASKVIAGGVDIYG